MLVRLARFWHWLEARQCFIRDTNQKIVPLIPNRAQCMVFAVMLIQAMLGRPIRVVILKARKVGITTFVESLYYHLCRFYRQQIAVMLAHQAKATDQIFAITKRIGDYDPIGQPKTVARVMTFGNRSSYWCHTAGGASVTAGGTPNLLHRSELALWAPGTKQAADYESGNAVGRTSPTSVIVDESTARGQDLFWGRFQAAEHAWHPFERVFIPWFVDDTLRSIVPDNGLALTEDETLVIARARKWGLEIPMEALAWRRLTIAEIGADVFKQEYPSTPEEAIETQQGLVLPGLRECVITHDQLPFHYPRVNIYDRVGGWDHGYDDPTATVSGIVWEGALYVIDCHANRGQLAEQHAQYVMPEHTYYCDPAALQARMEIGNACKQAGIPARFVPAPRLSSDRDREVNKAELRLVRKMAETGKLFILDTCADGLILEADNFTWNPKTGEPDDSRYTGDATDFDYGHKDRLKALQYMCVGVHLKGTHAKAEPRTSRPASRKEQLRRW
jgi:hypothetical protein